jgi:hypothetical protein
MSHFPRDGGHMDKHLAGTFIPAHDPTRSIPWTSVDYEPRPAALIDRIIASRATGAHLWV